MHQRRPRGSASPLQVGGHAPLPSERGGRSCCGAAPDPSPLTRHQSRSVLLLNVPRTPPQPCTYLITVREPERVGGPGRPSGALCYSASRVKQLNLKQESAGGGILDDPTQPRRSWSSELPVSTTKTYPVVLGYFLKFYSFLVWWTIRQFTGSMNS